MLAVALVTQIVDMYVALVLLLSLSFLYQWVDQILGQIAKSFRGNAIIKTQQQINVY